MDGHSTEYSDPGTYDSAAAGGDHHQTYDPQEDYYSHGQPQDSGNQQSGGASTEYSVEASVQVGQEAPQPGVPPPYYGQAPQQGGYRPPQKFPKFPTAGSPPPAYIPNHRPQQNEAYPPPPPQEHNHAAPNVYPPPNPGPAPGYAPPVARPTFQQQAVTPPRPPPTGGPTMGARLNQVTVRPDIGPPVPWASELFGCFEDCYGCPLVILAPCITFGQIAEIVDTGYNRCQTAGIIYGLAFFLGIPCLYSYTYRTKMRHRFNLREDPLDDFCTHFWCEWCALAQEYRELRYRGIDPSLGYEMQQVAITKAMEAPVPPRMQAF